MVIAFLVAWLALSILVFVLWPLFSRQPEKVSSASRLAAEREAAAAALREVTWDYNLGNIAPEEFRAIEAQYRERLEGREPPAGTLEVEVEREVASAREELRWRAAR